MITGHCRSKLTEDHNTYSKKHTGQGACFPPAFRGFASDCSTARTHMHTPTQRHTHTSTHTHTHRYSLSLTCNPRLPWPYTHANKYAKLPGFFLFTFSPNLNTPKIIPHLHHK